MTGIINLLPDALANQIAAGEVIQRPASVVKELLENAIDAGSNQIKLIIKDAGKTLIQVVDDGRGMNEVDARLCFERHATSKIKQSDDLFNIRSFGFRGEALASIAAVAQVELKTQEIGHSMGSQITIEGSKVKKQETISMNHGSSFTVKNLFYNVPARRKFLKSDPVELRHIIDEFAHVAIANPSIFFSLHHNDNELYHLIASNQRQRLINYFGKQINERIIPVNEETDFIKISGFVGKPELIKKSRGDQYFFVNNRYIKSNYLNHAVKIAYEKLIPDDHYPWYVIMLEVDPAFIDVNIHPTKQEIKFENERLIYNYLKVSIRHALGKYSIVPTLDFEVDMEMPVSVNSGTLEREKAHSHPAMATRSSASDRTEWLKFYEEMQKVSTQDDAESGSITLSSDWEKDSVPVPESTDKVNKSTCFQLNESFIISPIKSGLLIIDQQAAHERVLYEKHLVRLKGRQMVAQNSLFPETIQLQSKQVELLETILEDLRFVGFSIEKFGQNTFVINAVPSEGLDMTSAEFVQLFLDTFMDNLELQLGINENIARSLARNGAIKKGKRLSAIEMQALVDQLFASEMPFTSPTGKKCFVTYSKDELEQRFK